MTYQQLKAQRLKLEIESFLKLSVMITSICVIVYAAITA